MGRAHGGRKQISVLFKVKVCYLFQHCVHAKVLSDYFFFLLAFAVPSLGGARSSEG